MRFLSRSRSESEIAEAAPRNSSDVPDVRPPEQEPPPPEERFRSAFRSAPFGIAIIDTGGRFVQVNNAFCELLGYTEREFEGLHFNRTMFPEDLPRALMRTSRLRSGPALHVQAEQRFKHRSGREVWTLWSASLVDETDPRNSNFIFQVQNISDRKRQEEQLRHDATHDGLTGLPNRAYFVERLVEALQRSKHKKKYRVNVLFIDIDRFKNVNDSLGHTVGDKLLIAISHRLKASMRPPDLVARLGGDEFIVLVEGRYYMEDVNHIAERIHRTFDDPFDIDGHVIFSSASIGILEATDAYGTAEDVIRDADIAMYHAKNLGKSRHAMFDHEMRVKVSETLQLETDLRATLKNDALSVVYQPIVDLQSGEVAGFEALARWKHPTLGMVSPARFIPVAEEIGCIEILGEQLLRKSCSTIWPVFSEFSPEHLPKLSVNLSFRQFGRPDLVKRVRNILTETGFPAERLKLEITESVYFEYQENVLEMLNELRSFGIELDVDDFGTGYSNLSHLAKLPISSLKIDRSFITKISRSGANLEIVRTIIAMARNLGLGVVAEGIETDTQMETLRSLGCDRGQGYLLGMPMDIGDVREFLLRSQPRNFGTEPAPDIRYELPLQ